MLMFGSTRPLSLGRSRDGDRLSRNDAFHVLSNRRRRYALHYLHQHDDAVELRDLAEQVAAWENGTTPAELDSSERKSVYISLHQSHLPKMDEVGVVEYDKDGNTVALTESASQLAVHLEVVTEDHLPWSEVYLGLAAVGVALVAALWVDTYPFTLLPDLAWATGIVVAFAVAAAAHTYATHGVTIGGDGPPAELVDDADESDAA
jgi:hypothetical protein